MWIPKRWRGSDVAAPEKKMLQKEGKRESREPREHEITSLTVMHAGEKIYSCCHGFLRFTGMTP